MFVFTISLFQPLISVVG